MKTPMARVHNENREKEKSCYFFSPDDFGLRSPVVHKNQLFETKNDTPIVACVPFRTYTLITAVCLQNGTAAVELKRVEAPDLE